MDAVLPVLHWFTGGENQYMKLAGCMKHDTLWITLTVLLDLAVAAGYGLIAMHWWRNERSLPDIPAKRALGNMRNIFAFCGICGYLFIPIKMVWPAWRLYDFFMAALVYFTWRYAWSARDLRVVYSELGRSTRLAEDLQRSRAQTEEKSFFLNAISHDLRTPLNGLTLQASAAELAADANDSESLRSALMEIKVSALATSQLLDRLLEYGRSGIGEQSNDMAEFRLNEVMCELDSRFRAAAQQKQLELDVRCDERLMVRSDRMKLERILSNLLDNAIKFTIVGGVRVEVEHARAAASASNSAGAGNATVGATAGQSGIEIHVIDTGIGIAASDVERLFEEFYQVHNDERDRTKGFGIGLSIARRLARQIGGDVLVQSALGRGSRFSLVISSAVTGFTDRQDSAGFGTVSRGGFGSASGGNGQPTHPVITAG